MDLSSTADALRDAQRSKKKGIMLDVELDNCRRILEDGDAESEYHRYLLHVLGKARENVVDSDGVNSGELDRRGKGHSYLMPGRKNTGKRVMEEEDTNNEYQNFQRPISGKAKINESHKRRRGNVYIDLVEDSDAGELDRRGKGHSYRFPVRKGKDGGAKRKAVVQKRLHQKPRRKNNRMIQYQNEHVDQDRSVGKYKELMSAKFKGRIMVKLEFKVNKKATVMADNENFHQGRRNNGAVRNHCERVDRQPGKKVDQRELIKVGQGKHGLSHHKAVFKNSSVKKEPDDGVKIRSVKTAFRKDVVEEQIKLMKVGQGGHGSYSVKIEPDEGVKTRQHTEEVKRKMNKEDNVKSHPEVEILDGTAFIKGMPSPFVPSTTDTDLHNPDSPTLDEFRKELLEVLKKPYDIREYKQHREAIRTGSFFKHYPDLGKKLAVHRYKRKKCLTIVRGFFFWLKNVCREGAFPPWKDRQCLAIEPGSP